MNAGACIDSWITSLWWFLDRLARWGRSVVNARDPRRNKSAVTVRGAWLPMSLEFLRSRAWADLSPHAAKMLLDLCSGLGANAKGNGDLSAAPAIMRPRGWSSDATRTAALHELERAELILITRRGNRRQCALYAVTLWPLDCDQSKLEHGPGAFTTSDWTRVSADRAERPTMQAPAKWKRPRKSEDGAPVAGQPQSVMRPPRANVDSLEPRFDPVTGAKAGFVGLSLIPSRDTFLEGHLKVLPAGRVAGDQPTTMALARAAAHLPAARPAVVEARLVGDTAL